MKCCRRYVSQFLAKNTFRFAIFSSKKPFPTQVFIRHGKFLNHFVNIFVKKLLIFLQSVSANFTRSSSELYSEIDKWAGNFVITFRNSEAISELRFEIRKFKLRVYEETSKMSEKKT